MKKIILLALVLLNTFCAFSQSAERSGFVDGFDESKYEPIWISSIERIKNEAYKAGVYESAPGIAFKCQGHLVLNKYDKDDPDIQMRNLRFFGDGEYCFGFWADGKSFPDDMPLFTSVEIYYSFVANRFRGEDVLICYIDGWEVVNDVRFVNQKYIAADALKIREAPSLSAKQIGRLVKAERATVIEVGEDATIDGIESAWVKVRTKDGAEGWCFAGYLADGTEYREKPWKSTVKIGAYEKRKFVEILCAFDWYIHGVDDSIVYRFYTKDGNLYLNEYCYDVHDDVSLKLEYKGLPVEIVEREGKLLCECDEIRLSAYLGKEVALYDGKLRGTLYHSFDDEPYLYAFERYRFGKGENE